MTNAIAVLNFWLLFSAEERCAVRDSISAIESGHRDTAVGRRGERSRFQVMPGVWKAYCDHPISKATDPVIAWVSVASKVLDARVEAYHRVMGKRPDFAILYALWSRPGKLRDPKTNTYNLNRLTKKERERCQRFRNMVEENLKGGAK